MSPKSRRKSALVGGVKAPSLRSRLETVEAHLRSDRHQLVDAPLIDTSSAITSLGQKAVSASPKTSSFPESLDVIYSDLARLQNLLEAINNRLYGDGSPASDAAAATAPYSVSDKTTTIRSQANHCMNYAESILNRF